MLLAFSAPQITVTKQGSQPANLEATPKPFDSLWNGGLGRLLLSQKA